MFEQDRSVMNRLVASGAFDPTLPTTSLELRPGDVVSVPTAMLVAHLAANLAPNGSDTAGAGAADELTVGRVGERAAVVGGAEVTVIPVIEEQLTVGKRLVPLETVRLVKTSEPFVETAEIDLVSERWEITKQPHDTEVQERSPMRTEGDTSIYPVYEERLVARKALFLVEEVHVRKVRETRHEVVEEELHREVLTVERNVV